MRIISGKYGRRRFSVPGGIVARPTTDMARENLFNILRGITDIEGATTLDLFAGTGAITFEMLSRGAAHATAVEKAAPQTRFINDVARQLGCQDDITIIRGDAMRFIDTATTAYDIVFADPPYNLPGFGDIPAKVLAGRLLHPGSLFIIEHSDKYDFSELPHFCDHRTYGAGNFSFFSIPAAGDDTSAE